MRIWTGLGAFEVRFRPDPKRPLREHIQVLVPGPLELEVTDPATIARVLRLLLYDLCSGASGMGSLPQLKRMLR